MAAGGSRHFAAGRGIQRVSAAVAPGVDLPRGARRPSSIYGGNGDSTMRRYVTDRHGLISSSDIADALRRAEARERAEDARRQEREARRVRRWTALRGFFSLPPSEPKTAH
jgi:hypothetical protein